MSNTKAMETQMPLALKKLFLDIGINFMDWCKTHGFKRENARNVASGINQGLWGDSVKIKEQLQKDFPEIYNRGKMGNASQQKKRHAMLRQQVEEMKLAKAA